MNPTAFDADLARRWGQKHYGALCAQALPSSAQLEIERRFSPWFATHVGSDATRPSASDTWLHTVLTKAAGHGVSGDGVALDFLRFAKLIRATEANALWMRTPWLKAIREKRAPAEPKGAGWKRSEDVGLGLFRWDWSTLQPADVREQKIAPRPVWLVVIAKSSLRVHELSETLGVWLSAFPRSLSGRDATRTKPYLRACADEAMLTQAQKLGLIVWVPKPD